MTPARKATPAEPPELLRARIEEFVRGCRAPAVFEPGEKTISLEDGCFDLQVHGSTLVLHAWNAETSLVRRLVRVREEQRGRLVLVTRRLGQGDGEIIVVDRVHAGPYLERQVDRLGFRERFRRILARELGGWQVAQISAAPDLEHSLSPAYTRALLVRGQSAFAAIAADWTADAAACQHILSSGLIWLEYLRAREKRRVVEGLKVFLPAGGAVETGNRLAHLDRTRAKLELYEIAEGGAISQVEEASYGNLATSLDPACAAGTPPEGRVAEWLETLVAGFGAENVARADGVISLRLRGLEFARASGQVMTYGIEEERPVTPATFERVEALAAEIAAARSADAPDRQHWLFRAAPERWLESQVRANIARIDGTLLPEPIYTQVPAIAGSDRGIIDLLAVDRRGRLAVIELKASEDIHLPLQGLDYWMRVKWHLDRGEFAGRGYFRGIGIQPAPPRLLLVSPAFDFHATTENILGYFSPQVEVERVGLGMDWRREMKVVFRARGAERPAQAAGTNFP